MSKPQAGKIHSLPIRVSYTVDGQGSYCTVLNERHDVFVHPAPSSARHGHSGHSSGANGRGRNGTPVRAGSHSGCEAGARSGDVVGSCCLRDVAWGVCYASPECVPAPRYHDFSVYTLDPSRPLSGPSRLSTSVGSSSNNNTPVPAHRRISHVAHAGSSPAIPSGTSPHVPHTPGTYDAEGANAGGNTYAWHGKGFLSWALYEPPPGSTLVKGRLVRSGEFEGVAVVGGLEGLMAAAAAAEREGSASTEGRNRDRGTRSSSNHADDGEVDADTEDEDGTWGLEVELSLKMVHLGGRVVGDKKEFGEMIARGKDVVAGAPPPSAAGYPHSQPLPQHQPTNGRTGSAAQSAGQPHGATSTGQPRGTHGQTGSMQGRSHAHSPALSTHSTGGMQGGSNVPSHSGLSAYGDQQSQQSQQQQQQQGAAQINGQGQNRPNAPRRIEPRLISQPGQNTSTGASNANAQQSSLSSNNPSAFRSQVPQPPAQPIRTSTAPPTSAVPPLPLPGGGPHRSSSASTAPFNPASTPTDHAGAGSMPAPTSGRSGTAFGAGSTPMEQSSSTQSHHSQSHSQARGRPAHTGSSSSAGFNIPSDPISGGRYDSGSQLSSSTGGDERVFGSDTTPRAQRPTHVTQDHRQAQGPGKANERTSHDASHSQQAHDNADEDNDEDPDDPDREVTPPPISRPMGPPCTPGARAALAALLGPDGRMSPTAVKALANSSTFRKLLAQAPSPVKLAQAHGHGGAQEASGKDGSLRSPFGSSSLAGRSDMGAKDPANPFLSHPPAFASASTSTSGSGHRQSVPLAKPSPATSDIPTPASSASFHAHGSTIKPDPSAPAAPGPSSSAATTPIVNTPTPGGCNNCGTLHSEQWRIKKYKNGTQMTVCNDCGLYFNAHKKMRPKELWGTASGGGVIGLTSNPTAAAGPGQGQGQGGSAGEREEQQNGANKRAKVEGSAGVRSSPRKTAPDQSQSGPSNAGSSLNEHTSAEMSMPMSHTGTGSTDSPRRKKRPPPPPSPRRATRAAVKEHPEAFAEDELDRIFGTGSSGGMGEGVGTGVGMSVSNSAAGQNDANSSNSANNNNGNGNGNIEFDINQLFNSGTAGIDLSALQGMQGMQGMQGSDGMDGIDSNIDFDAILAQFVNEGGEMGQIWNDLGMGGFDGLQDMQGMSGNAFDGMQGMQGMDGMGTGEASGSESGTGQGQGR